MLRWPEVTAKVGFTRQYLSKLIARGDFPEPAQLGRNSVAFFEHEVDAWLEARPRGPIGKPHLVRSAGTEAA
jgi:predicted DNA-binding transcriptional regulator AlpA